MTTAAYHGRTEILELLLTTGPELDIFEASTVGRTARVEALVDAGADIRSKSPDGLLARLTQNADHLQRQCAWVTLRPTFGLRKVERGKDAQSRSSYGPPGRVPRLGPATHPGQGL